MAKCFAYFVRISKIFLFFLECLHVASRRDFKMSLRLIIVTCMSLTTSWETLQGDNHCIYFFYETGGGVKSPTDYTY
jgi:hypothetical protein